MGKKMDMGNNSQGELIYKGEFSNGKRDGIGKEYNKEENSVYEGEFSCGNWKKGKYYVNGNLIFEGEYCHGDKHGKCKEYDINGKLIFDGEYNSGEKKIQKNKSLASKKCLIF